MLVKLLTNGLTWLTSHFQKDNDHLDLLGTPRSSKWAAVRNEHLKKEPCCQVCGSKDNLNVHHIIPFHLDAEKELDPTNLITLCEGGHPYRVNCHFLFGHLLDWKDFNPTVVGDAKEWNKKITDRRSCL